MKPKFHILLTHHKTISAVIARDSAKIQEILNTMEDPTLLPAIAHVEAVGTDGHYWAWDQLEDWQTS